MALPINLRKCLLGIAGLAVAAYVGFQVFVSSQPNIAAGQAPESNAVAALRILSEEENSFKAALVKDQDQDGIGEYGTLAELAGQVPPAGKDTAVDPPYIDSQLGTGLKSRYNFVIQLGEEAEGKSATVNDQESRYFAVAWPLNYTKGSRRTPVAQKTFCIDETGVIRARDIGGLRTTRETATSKSDPWEPVGG